MESSYVVREFRGTDPAFDQYRALVLATWLRGLKHGSDFFSMVDSKTFFQVYSRTVLLLLRRPDCKIRIAVLSSDPDVAVGWSAFEAGVLHFVYVRPQGRRQGIARSLLPPLAKIEVVSHMTKTGKSLWKKKLEHAKFNPF